ncbi:unnamed protein product, partial [Staurois parvus]
MSCHSALGTGYTSYRVTIKDNLLELPTFPILEGRIFFRQIKLYFGGIY